MSNLYIHFYSYELLQFCLEVFSDFKSRVVNSSLFDDFSFIKAYI